MACLRWAPLRWGALVWCVWLAGASHALARDGGLAALSAPEPPAGAGRKVPAAAEAAPRTTRQALAPAAAGPVQRRGLAGIVVGWSGVGAAIGSFALMATCGALMQRASDHIDHDQLTEDISADVDAALDDGAGVCRTVYAAFGAAGAGVGLLGLSIGYARRHRALRGGLAGLRFTPSFDRKSAQLRLSAEF